MAQLSLQKVDTNLVTQGLGTFELPTTQEDNVGGYKQVVEEACEILIQKAQKMRDFKEELESSKNSLLDGSWTGQAADDFAAAFPTMTSAFENIAPCIQSLAEWAQSTMEAYEAVDLATAGVLNSILSGVGGK